MATATSSPRVQGRSPPPEALPSITENGKDINGKENRKSSLNFLRRSKSTEPLGDRKASGGRMNKKMLKEQAREEERRQREAAISRHAPRLPDLSPTPQLETFGGKDKSEDESAVSSRVDSRTSSLRQAGPVPPLPGSQGRESYDPYARAESMTHRGRFSYASSAVSSVNSPRRLRRRKDPTPYNILVIGARNSGKTSFLDFLRTSLALPPNKHPTRHPEDVEQPNFKNPGFTYHYLETEIDAERVGLTLWDSQGIEKNMVDLQLREITHFIESKFEETFAEEMKVIRSPGVRDTHIHCVFLILDPSRLDQNITAATRTANGLNGKLSGHSGVIGALDEDLDVQVLRTLLGKTTVVPVISKADTVTTAHMAYLKKAVWDSLKMANIDPLEVLTLEEQDDYSSSASADRFDENEEDEESQEEKNAAEAVKEPSEDQAAESETQLEDDGDVSPDSPSRHSQKSQRSHRSQRSLSSNSETPSIPLSILSPDPHSMDPTKGPVGRQFPWGFADPYNPEHCDFVKLKDAVFTEWRSELREASREIWYEGWRTNRLNRKSVNGAPAPVRNGNGYSGRQGPGYRGGIASR
ncbi:hypothetical protein DTO166G4_728 [Paecilomyces variotii]|uniref:Cell division protein Sep4a n=1 Tax=Byssochlamys spectabilis TaxID=264951 RepID=A0A443I4L5_BYSSP|nr:cell division protein Sep4a [Paecilomyces variotii]KAJ9205052.1 hypothetical protein DTO164E3_1675 [Paecilomyces variotii]KAJ9207051.1 hypothetical protein DTO032I3_1639 [Paecilomyces variotii]KAJ9217546.1 hypothetical protein DTO166G4_728 [Paecilomyces variotii]KAJ9228437.1 hypothetical protein DTO169E5_9171 [Paecilomyces variotii]KAJ9242969.1 hypothetical protein DTO166G5_73 [Paecilomyces variotii]